MKTFESTINWMDDKLVRKTLRRIRIRRYRNEIDTKYHGFRPCDCTEKKKKSSMQSLGKDSNTVYECSVCRKLLPWYAVSKPYHPYHRLILINFKLIFIDLNLLFVNKK